MCEQVGMTTGATIHTTEGLHMIATPRQHGPSPQEAEKAHIENGNTTNGHAGNGASKELAKETLPVGAKR